MPAVEVVEVSSVVVNALTRNWVFVKVVTSEPGIIGWGEATLEWKTRAVLGALEDLRPLVVGQDPMRIEHIWQRLYRQQFFKGGPVAMSALSGIDQALWDVKGKLLGVPAYQLLGGAVRDQVRLYDNLGGGQASAVYGMPTAAAFAAAARRSVDAGFDAVKILPVPTGAALPGGAELHAATERLVAVRAATGEDVDILVDLHGRTSAAGALAFGRVLAPHRPWFFEEPCQPEDMTAMAEVARALPIPVATGERLITLAQFRDLLNLRAAAVIQPDVCHVGGITALRKISALAETYQVAVAPHNPLGPIATWANLQVDFATPTFLIQEVMRGDVPWRDDVVTTPAVVGGRVNLPDRPGLGVDVDEEAARRHPYQPEPQPSATLADGSVADW